MNSIKVDKKEWLEGLILMAINSTRVKDKKEQHAYSLSVSKSTADIILNNINRQDVFE